MQSRAVLFSRPTEENVAAVANPQLLPPRLCLGYS